MPSGQRETLTAKYAGDGVGVAPLALHRRYRRENRMKALAIGGTVDRLHGMLSLPGTMSFAKTVQFDQRRILKMDARKAPEIQEVRLARRIRCIQRQRVTNEKDHFLHSRAEGASPQEDFSRRVSRTAG